jgi:hypothetical protein
MSLKTKGSQSESFSPREGFGVRASNFSRRPRGADF